ncbi:hypothetical protein AAU61_13985 [Desulfocarbo indianensis]|nr:hypothetical protein AAU61_13985 [Desulfocarbo indianensis]
MGIEFDPVTSSYYQTAYTGQAVERPTTEPPPQPPVQEAAPVEEPPPPLVDLPPLSEDPSLTQANSGYPGGLNKGSIVDEVV